MSVLRHADMGLAYPLENLEGVIFLSATDAVQRKDCQALPHREGQQAAWLWGSVQTPSVSVDIDYAMKLLMHMRKKLWAITSAAGKVPCYVSKALPCVIPASTQQKGPPSLFYVEMKILPYWPSVR